MGQLDVHAEAHRLDPGMDQPLSSEERTSYMDTARDFGVMCRHVHLQSACDQIARILDRLNDEELTGREYFHLHSDLHNRIEDDFSHHIMLVIPQEDARYVEQQGKLFGEKVIAAFPTAIEDIEEAGKCYALDRSTACVFHLMHVIEIGLRALGKVLNEPKLDPTRNPAWEAILSRCDDELKKPAKDRTPEWSAKNQFFSEATANLRAVKDAWRNPTLHVEKKYDHDEALDALNAVGAFMRHLASELHE
jgi:hypothetical protein